MVDSPSTVIPGLRYRDAQAAGATVVRPLNDPPYGGREFAVKDPEGHSWTAATYDPWVAHKSQFNLLAVCTQAPPRKKSESFRRFEGSEMR